MWADSYIITIIGEIQALQTSTYSVSFTLTVEGTCKYSTETIVLTAGTSLASQTYAIGDPLKSYTIEQFTENA